jgi:hypothetical protein
MFADRVTTPLLILHGAADVREQNSSCCAKNAAKRCAW